MKKYHFLDAETCIKLAHKIKSALGFYWVESAEGLKTRWEIVYMGGEVTSESAVPAIHFSDLLLRENAMEIWGEEITTILMHNAPIDLAFWKGANYKLLSMVRNQEDWRKWMRNEIKPWLHNENLPL